MKRPGYKSKVALGIIDVLADVERATIRKLAEDIGCHTDTVRVRINDDLLPRRLVESAGKIKTPGVKKSPMSYRLHRRLRDPAHERLHLFR